jgi:glyoxylase-like metal-dependent hydrolase (beta-lactamase superfamily II)
MLCMNRESGDAERVSPLVRRILAPNPSPFTFTGTQSFIVGDEEVALIDPGPDLPVHVEALLEAVRGRRLVAILCTHTHRDHSPASRAIKAATAAPIVGCAALAMEFGQVRADDEFDLDYVPDRVLADGETLEGKGWTLEAVATPGHTSNHLCFALAQERALFSGDHVMGWSTSVVAPPDGNMGDYMRSLDRLLERDERIYYPAHGDEIAAPHDHVRRLIEHRRGRERQVLGQLKAGEGRITRMVGALYPDIDPRLHGAAGLSILAHLLDLEARGLVTRSDESWSLT